MGFDINGFKKAFFTEMRKAGNAETTDSQINTAKEANMAKDIQSAFKSELANISNPIGDTFAKTSDVKGEFDEVSVNDLMALIDDSDLNIARVNEFIAEKPVEQTTLSTLRNVVNVKQPEEVAAMAEISDADTEGVNFYTDNAIATGRDKKIAKNIEVSEEGIEGLGPKFFDAFMEALYAA